MTALRAPDGTPIIGISGWKNSGKTTLTVALIAEFVKRGLRVASVKHAHHNLRIDDKDTDSARHRRAGAAQVAVVSEKRWAIVTELDDRPEPDFHDIIARLDPCDLIVVEGYKSHPIAKIETRRLDAVAAPPLAATDPHVIAIAADHHVAENYGRPVFDLDAVGKIADFAIQALHLSHKARKG